MSEFVSKSIKFIFGVMMLGLVGLCLFGTGVEYVCKVNFALPNMVYALLGIIVLGVVGLAAQGIGRLLEKSGHAGLIMVVLSGLFFFGLVWLTYQYYFVTGWDANVVEMSADSIARKDWDALPIYYYYYCPNNVFLTFLFSLVIRLGYLVGITNHYFCVIVLQCFFFALTGLILYRTADLLVNVRIGVTVWLIYIFMVGLSPWVTVPYSDATGVMFPALLLYLYVLVSKGMYVKPALFFMMLCTYVGYRIKPQIVIVTIAIVIVTIARLRKSQLSEMKSLLGKFVVVVAGLLFGMIIVTVGMKATHLEENKDLSYGMLHYLMMGLNEEAGGVINVEDQQFSWSFNTAEERAAGNWQVIQERVKELGPRGLLRLFKNKTLTNFSDGTFAWWQEGNIGGFLVEPRYDGNPTLRSILSGYFYEGGNRYTWFMNYSQTLWLGILAVGLLSVFLPLKGKSRKELDVLRLSLIGITLFEMLFEARARYVFIYVPLFVLAAGMVSMQYGKGKDNDNRKEANL